MELAGIKSIIPGVIEKMQGQKLPRYAAMTKAWESAVGTEEAKHSEPYALRGRILFVRVDDSTRAFDLSRKSKTSLIRRMQHELGDDQLQDIVFRVGELSRSHRVQSQKKENK